MNPHARLGAFVLAALLLLAFATGKVGDIVWPKQENHIVEAEFDDLMGLDVQSPVRMAGVKIGIVQEILLRNNRAVVRIALNPDVKLPASTHATIISRGLVGEKNLALSARPGDTEWLKDGVIIPSDPSGDINTFIAKATGITDDIQSLTGSISGESGGAQSSQSFQQVIANINNAALELSLMVKENRSQVGEITASLQRITQQLEKELPVTTRAGREFFEDGKLMIRDSRAEIRDITDSLLRITQQLEKELPQTTRAGREFFEQGKQVSENLNASLIDNRENLYRSLFELRLASENLEAFSDDIRRNPWKLMKEKPEIKADKRARQEKMEEMLMTTGRMGIAPATK
ncbi:MAG: MCE family protein [Zetaproteobacteria bacterium CG_4_9_14_3_um_filter_53_7]|nr:MAG: MCE family protein [Zetaproteobacteria bacterium CG_4_9_14_3_um_filter_53_7]